MKRYLMVSLFCLLAYVSAYSQFQAGKGLPSFYFADPKIVNPSLAGLSPILNFSGFYSSSLEGFKDHPRQSLFSASGFFQENAGLAFKLSNYESVLLGNTAASAAFVYKTPIFSKGDKLSFFLGAEIFQDRFDVGGLHTLDPNDPSFSNMAETQTGFDAAFGFSFFRDNSYYYGLSVENLLPSQKQAFRNDSLSDARIRYYSFIGSQLIKLAPKFDLELIGAAKASEAKAYVWDAGLRLKYGKILSLGASYRSIGAVSTSFTVTCSQTWSVGFLGEYGVSVGAKDYTYKPFSSCLFIRKVFDEHKSSKPKTDKP
jgi:type IX secretion system PorP/SprF family membrane protein